MKDAGASVLVGILSYSDSPESIEDLLSLPDSMVGVNSETIVHLNNPRVSENESSHRSAALFLLRSFSTQLLQVRRGSWKYRLRAFLQAIALILKLPRLVLPNYRTKVWKESERAASICSGHFELICEFLASDKEVAVFFEDDAKLIDVHLLSSQTLQQVATLPISILNLTESYPWKDLRALVTDSLYPAHPGGQSLLRVVPPLTNTVAAYAMNRITAKLVALRLRKRIEDGATLMHFDWELNRILASSQVESLTLATAPFRQNERFREPKI